MRFSLSGEISLKDEQYEKFRVISNEIRTRVNEYLTKRHYGDAVNVLFLAPTIFSFEAYVGLPYKERKIYRKKDKSTDYRLAIDYNEFVNADDKEKERLLIENIIHAIRDLKRKIKKGFDGDKLEADILSLFSLKSESIREREELKRL
ncbi:MAG: Imm44 family immunity protein [Candidatus Paceibacterota bacterium]